MESLALYSPSSATTSAATLHHHLRLRRPIAAAALRPISSLRSPLSAAAAISFSPLHHKPIFSKPISRTHLITTVTHASASASASASLNDDVSAAGAKPELQVAKPELQGAKLIPLIISVSIGLIVRFLVPRPAEISAQAWQLLAIFLSTIAGLVLSPLPVGAWAFLGLTSAVLTKTLTFSAAFSAFTNEVIWLIVISFFFARGFVKTGLGDRIATYFVKWLGKSTLGLSYGLTLSEALIAPAMPSTTARAGGVFLPIIKSLSLSSGSKPGDSSSRKLGSFLIQYQFQQLTVDKYIWD